MSPGRNLGHISASGTEAAGEEVMMKIRRQSPSPPFGLAGWRLTRVRLRLNLELERQPEAQSSSTFDLEINPARRHETFRLITVGRVG
jgi:hypothetical protein